MIYGYCLFICTRILLFLAIQIIHQFSWPITGFHSYVNNSVIGYIHKHTLHSHVNNEPSLCRGVCNVHKYMGTYIHGGIWEPSSTLSTEALYCFHIGQLVCKWLGFSWALQLQVQYYIQRRRYGRQEGVSSLLLGSTVSIGPLGCFEREWTPKAVALLGYVALLY